MRSAATTTAAATAAEDLGEARKGARVQPHSGPFRISMPDAKKPDRLPIGPRAALGAVRAQGTRIAA